MFFNTGIVGFPLKHSLSPLLHNFFIYHTDLNGGYCCFEVPENSGLPKTLSFLKEKGFRGINVTLPYKVTIMDYVDEIDDLALDIGAVNTLIIQENGNIYGTNTDIYGIEKTFERFGVSCSNKNVLVLGAGGSSKALFYYLKRYDCESLTIVNRTPEKADEILANSGITKAETADLEALKKDNVYDIIINTTSVGLDGGGFLDMSKISCREFAFDFQYSKTLTPFLKEYRNQNIIYSDGLMMLIYQGAKSFFRWAENLVEKDRLNFKDELDVLDKKLRRVI